MNSVHERCPKSDSETVLSPKIGWVHQVHSLLAQQHTQVRTGEPRRAHRRTHTAISWPGCPTVSYAFSGRIMGAGLSCRGLASRPCRDTAACPSPGLLSQYTEVYCDTKPSQTSPFCHNTVNCIAIQFL